ncbi:MAG: MMPL family transporter [Candidatus Brocadiales bacterium]|nr:MMPL family transporter [Candidatus Brocadiales bacterium]
MRKIESVITWSRLNPVIVVIVAGLITAFFAYQLPKIRVDASASRMMVKDDPNRIFYEETIETFGSDNTTVIYVKDEKLFTYEKLEAIEEIFYELYDVPGVSRVNGLYSVKNFKGMDGYLDTNPLLDPIPEEQEELDAARKDAINSPLMLGSMISEDGKVMAISVIAEPVKGDDDFDKNFSTAIDEVIAPLKDKVDEVFQIGTPLTRRSIIYHILDDQMTLVPLAVAILLVLLVVGLKSFNGAIIPVITGGLSVIWAVGFMTLMGIPIQVLTVIMPCLVLVLGATEDMHIISEYFNGVGEGKTKLQAIDYMSRKVSTAIVLTALTTFLGFASIILNDITLLKEFGIASTFGLFVNFWITITIVPACLRFFGESKSPFRKKHQEGEEGGKLFKWVAEKSIRIVNTKKRLAVIVYCVLVLISCYGITMIKVDNDLLGYFKASSDIRVKADILHEDLAGAQTFYIALKAPGHEKGAFKKSEFLKKIFATQGYIDGSGDFDNSVSLSNNIALVNREMNGGTRDKCLIPDKDELVSQYLLFFTRDDIDRYVSSDYSEANIVVRHNLSSSFDLRIALNKLTEVLKKQFDGTGIEYRYTSESILINSAAESIAVGQVQSLGLMGLIIFIIMCVLFVNIKAGFLSLVPNLFPIVLLYGVMGIFNVPLNPGTAMIAAIAIGIAVDDTIHFMVRYNAEMRILNDQTKAMESSIREETRPVLTTSIALALGFASLGFSHFVPLIYFGLLSAMVMVLALMSDMVITPMLLVSTKLITIWDMVALKLRETVIDESPLFQNMSKWQIKKIVLLAHTKVFNKGDFVIKQGTKERTMYLILDGSVQVESTRADGRKTVFQELNGGEVFGEIALVDEVERTADVVALGDNTQVIEIDWKSLERIRKILPHLASKLFLNISRILGRRLAAMNTAKVAHD